VSKLRRHAANEIVFWVGIALLVIEFIAIVTLLIKSDHDEKSSCRVVGSLVVETHDNGWVCVDRDGRIIDE
jgi:hypothetical protein